MGKFSKIKKYNLDSLSIDEKIKFLDKEMKKTGLYEQPSNSTKGVYVSTPTTPNQNFSDFEAIMTGGQRLGFSGADGNTAGNAAIGLFSGVDGVALSPPHPVTGLRTNAVHITTGLGDSTPLRPGVTITRGFSDNPPSYTMGSCLWFYDMDFDNGAGQPAGKWCNLEFSNFDGDSNGKWFFWDTIKSGQFAGVYVVNTDLSQHPCGDISDLIDNLNFPGVGGSIGTADTTVLTQDSVENPNFLAILMNLSGAAFDYLKDKASQALDFFKGGADDAAENLKDTLNDLKDAGEDFAKDFKEFMDEMGDFVADIGKAGQVYGDYVSGNLEDGDIDNDYLGQDYVDDAFRDAFINDKGTVTVGDNVIGSGGEVQYNPETGIVTIPFEYDFDTNEEQIMKDPDKYDATQPDRAFGMFLQWLFGGKYGLDSAPVPFAGYATWASKNLGIGGKPTTGHGITMPIEDVKAKNFPLYSHIIQNKIGVSESYISESAKLGHFEPEVLDVDIKKLRKNIMPEFPKKEPPKMIDGYSERSQLAPKKAEREPFIKITKKDLAKNHKLKDSEIKEFMDTFNMINDFVKKHPEELIYAQRRYPMSDKRLAALNWKMDQMLNAGQEYLDTQFPENQRLVDRIKKATKKTMELTNPEAYKGLKKPDMKLMSLDDHMKEKRVVSRHFKKKRQSKSMFRVDMKKVKEKNRKVAEQKVAEWQEKRRIELLNSNEFENQKSDWRKEFNEDFVNTTQGMKVGQTFTHVPSGQTVTTSGVLGGIETLQTSVPIFGDEIPGPDASQYGLQGFAKPIDMMRRGSTKKAEQLNKELDSSEKYTKEVKADKFMKARVDNSEKTEEWYKNRQKSGYYREKLGPIHGAMTDLDELKMNERLVQENERQHEIYKKNEAIRVKHQKVIDKKIKPLLDQINIGHDKKIDLETFYRAGAAVNKDGTRALMIRKETTSAMGLSLTKTVITTFRGKNISAVGSVANREKLGITGQGKKTTVAEIKDPRLIEYKMPVELEMWQSQSVDPRGAITRSAGAQLAKGGVKSAFDVLNYYIDNHVMSMYDANFDPNKQHNLTHLITDRTKEVLQKGMNELKEKGLLDQKNSKGQLDKTAIISSVNQYFKQHGGLADNSLLGQIQKVDIFNSLGNSLGFNVDHYAETGNYQFDSTYKFTSTLDMGVRLPIAGAIISALSRKYVSGQLHGETMMAVQNPMQFQVDIDSSKQYSPEPSKTVQGIKKLSKSKFDGFDRGDLSFKRKKKKDK